MSNNTKNFLTGLAILTLISSFAAAVLALVHHVTGDPYSVLFVSLLGFLVSAAIGFVVLMLLYYAVCSIGEDVRRWLR